MNNMLEACRHVSRRRGVHVDTILVVGTFLYTRMSNTGLSIHMSTRMSARMSARMSTGRHVYPDLYIPTERAGAH